MTHEFLSIGFDLVTMALTVGYMAKLVVGDNERVNKVLHWFGWSPAAWRGKGQSPAYIGATGQFVEGASELAYGGVVAKPSLSRQLVLRKSY